MAEFRLTDMDVRWSGVDSTTPAGHCLATGLDQLGNTRVWLFAGAEPSDGGFRGSLVIPGPEDRTVHAYGPSGGHVGSGYDQTELLRRLAGQESSDG